MSTEDVRGLRSFALAMGERNAAELLTVVDGVNTSRTGQVIDLVHKTAGDLRGRRVAVWGASFKPGTDDIRDSPGLKVADRLHQLGAEVTVYDPIAATNAIVAFPELDFAESALGAAAGVDVIVVVTAWPEFSAIPPAEVAESVAARLVVDACQGISATAWREADWEVASLTGNGTGWPHTDRASSPCKRLAYRDSRHEAHGGIENLHEYQMAATCGVELPEPWRSGIWSSCSRPTRRRPTFRSSWTCCP